MLFEFSLFRIFESIKPSKDSIKRAVCAMAEPSLWLMLEDTEEISQASRITWKAIGVCWNSQGAQTALSSLNQKQVSLTFTFRDDGCDSGSAA